MEKKAVVILAEGFEEIEASAAINILRRAGVVVTVAGLGKKQITGARGINVAADLELSEAGKDFDAVILPGGQPGADNLSRSEEVESLIYEIKEKGKIIAAICASPAIVLAPKGFLNGKTATCYPGLEKEFLPGTRFSKENVVADGNIITSRGPATSLEFALTIVEKLTDREIRKKIEKAILI